MSTHREIEEVYLEDIARISKMVKKVGDSLREMEKGEKTPAQWSKKKKKSTKK